uniref:Uncharacterized protein n=1 Tax=Cacopsylla melanoneura TaxID=428564 RepID=A0A8D8RZN5_9HEMI
MTKVSTMNINHYRIGTGNSSPCHGGIDIQVQAVLMHISYTFVGSNILQRLRTCRSKIHSLQILPTFVRSWRSESTFINRRQSIWNAKKCGYSSLHSLYRIEFRTHTIFWMRIVIEIHFKSLNRTIRSFHK